MFVLFVLRIVVWADTPKEEDLIHYIAEHLGLDIVQEEETGEIGVEIWFQTGGTKLLEKSMEQFVESRKNVKQGYQIRGGA